MKSDRPFWWPDAQGFAMGAIVIICGAALFIRMFHASNVDDKMLDTMITVLYTTCLVAVYQYLFGSSRSSSNKDETINRIATVAAETPKAPGVASAVTDAAKALVLLAALAIGLFAFAGDASAQIRLKPLSLGAAAATPVPTAKPATADALSKFMDDLSKVAQDVVTGVIADITAADADAGSLLNGSDPLSFKDPIAHACYPAEIKFLQSLPVATPPTGKYVLVQLFQKKRDFVAQIKAGLPDYLKLGCAALLGDEVQILTKSLGLIGVSVAANALLPGAGFALPTL